MYTIFTFFLSILMLFGGIHPATDHPITFKDQDAERMAFVAVSDVHICNTPYSEAFTSMVFEDVKNSGLKFDAYINCGDLADNGKKAEYDRLYRVLKDNQDVIPYPIIALGNHDARYALKENAARFRSEVEEMLGIDLNGKNYYAYDVNGYTFIVLGTEQQISLQAHFSDEQLAFLDSNLARATKDGKPAFVVCHQPLEGTHSTGETWSVGAQSDQVKEILRKYQNVFFFSGHVHSGFKTNCIEKLADSVWCLNLPVYGKMQNLNNNPSVMQRGVGYYAEVYDNAVIFTGRDFRKGKSLGITYACELAPANTESLDAAA